MSARDPIARFGELFAAAAARESADPTAAALATADAEGRPAVRIVLVKGFGPDGFRFFTNLESRKAADLAANPSAALCFWWPALGRQVRIEGDVTALPSADSDAYFATRPRDSQIGAWASQQSAPLGSREELLARVAEAARHHAGAPVPRPPFWGGYLLAPRAIEFWSAGEHRLHERERFRRESGGWTAELLYP